jgi:hypothetical protein
VTSSAVTSSSASGPAASAAPAQDAGTGDAFADEILKLHNDFRAQYGELSSSLFASLRLTAGAAPLTWNADAAAFAQSWASNCKFEHSQDSGYGENLAAGTGEGFDAAAGFSGWADEACECGKDARASRLTDSALRLQQPRLLRGGGSLHPVRSSLAPSLFLCSP